jgi:creatinine amidohydrolase/Fe(II)-dependent formamide hydrolase-like protein
MASAEGHLVDLSAAVVNSRTLEALSEGEAALYRAKILFTRTLDERWIGESGNMGDPTRATAANGDRLMRRTVETGLKLLDVLAEQQRHRAR